MASESDKNDRDLHTSLGKDWCVELLLSRPSMTPCQRESSSVVLDCLAGCIRRRLVLALARMAAFR